MPACGGSFCKCVRVHLRWPVQPSLQYTDRENDTSFDFISEFPAAKKEIAQWAAEGKIPRKFHFVDGGVDVFPEALSQLFSGANTGKT